MNHDTDKPLEELGCDLYRRFLHVDDPATQDALYQARRRALAAIPKGYHRRRWRGPAWISAGAVTATLMAAALVWHLQPPIHVQSTPAAIPAMANNAAAWKEDPALLENLDFAVWLAVAEPGDAG